MNIKKQTDFVVWPADRTPLVDIYELLDILYHYDEHIYNGVLAAMTEYDDKQFDILDALRGNQTPNEFGKIVKAAKINICGTLEEA